MALQIWLPLDGDFRNLGINTNQVTNLGTVTFSTNGKIGSCALFNANTAGTSCLRLNPILNNTSQFSISFWVKLNDISKNQCIFSQRVSTNAAGFTIFYLTGSGIRFDEGASLQSSQNLATNTWYHIVCCRNNSKKYIYINGVLSIDADKNSTSASNVNSNYCLIGGSQGSVAGDTPQTNANLLNGFLNDFRIYNHCLSPKEVKQISQGLILHYPFTDSFNIDLLQYDKTIYTESDGSQWVRIQHHNNPAAARFAKKYTEAEYAQGIYENEDRWYDIERVSKYFTKFEFMVKQCTTSSATEVKYRWIQNKRPDLATWTDVKADMVTRITTTGYTNGTFGGLWKQNSSSRMVIANANSSNWFGACAAWTVHNSGIPGYPNTVITSGYFDVYLCISKYPDNEIYDISGYNHNGTVNDISLLKTIYPSPRYNSAVQFGAVNSPNIIVDINSVLPSLTNCTISWWEKPNNTSNKLLFQGQSSYEYIGAANASSTSMYSLHIGSSGAHVYYDGIVQPNTYGTASGYDKLTNTGLYHKTDKWHHFIFSGINLSAWTAFKFNTYGSWPMNMNLVDFRIYATALSANDAKELYETSMVVDASGNITPRVLT